MQHSQRAEDVVARILAREGTALESTSGQQTHSDAGALEREERAARTRTQGTDLGVSEVEYRRVALERVILVGLWFAEGLTEAENSLRELAALAQTAGAQVVQAVLQRRETPDPGTYLGSGKAQEVKELARTLKADTVIVDAELAPSQRRGLEDCVNVKVVDRTAVILDIFAQHAKSREGKAQVELAQMQYMMPRLRGWGQALSRQAGGRAAGGEGIGSRGPGETKIEMDRRRIRARIAKLRKEIDHMKSERDTKRKSRRRARIPAVVVVGYTNAGKSSLMNRLAGSEIMVADELFATLDPTVRRVKTAEGRPYTLTDTVGFVRNLPHELIAAFQSTLEEVAAGDLLLHVVDGAHPDPDGQITSVRKVLTDIEGARDIPELIVFNKADLMSAERTALLRSKYSGSLVVSAATGQGMAVLSTAIAARLPAWTVPFDLVIPFTRGDLVARLHSEAEVENIEYMPEGTHVVGQTDPALMGLLREAAL
ncbi:MAG: GTPase HflX [Actinomycetaceae bacterium]|nr:GTPase HflX [Actinomycetaceae bacterium]